MLSAFALTNCTQEIDNPAQQPEETGYPFEIVASTVDTKTVNDGMHTKWAEGDQINLFHAVTDGTDYQSNGAFTVKDVEAGSFTGNLSETLDVQEEYDWFALYPYNANGKTPAALTQADGFTYIGHSKGLNQTGYDSKASLKGSVCPLYGVAKAVSGTDMPTIKMNHLSSVVAINITNNTDKEITITTASLTAEEEIVGSFYIDFTKTEVIYTPSEGYTYKTATVNVSEGNALTNGMSAILYLAIKPFTAKEGSKLILSVNGYKKELTMSNDVTFSAGKIKTLNFSYDSTEEPTGPEELTIEEFLAKDVSTAVLYRVTGTITDISEISAQYKNATLTIADATGELYIYRMKASTGGTAIDKLGLKAGDLLTVDGNLGEYNGSKQMTNGVYVSHQSSCEAPVITCEDNVVTIEAETGATIYYTVDGETNPTTASFVYDGPFEIKETTTVMAIAVVTGKPQSAIAIETCNYFDPDAVVTGGGRDDFNTVNANSSYAKRTTTAGWVGTNCAVLQGGTVDNNPTFKVFGTADVKAFCMNGKTSAKGTIESPTLTDGCGTLTFNYTYPFSESKAAKIKVEVIQNGATVKEFTVTGPNATKFAVHEETLAINVSGDFKIKFSNLSPSNSSSNKDRTAIWNIEWTGYAN